MQGRFKLAVLGLAAVGCATGRSADRDRFVGADARARARLDAAAEPVAGVASAVTCRRAA